MTSQDLEDFIDYVCEGEQEVFATSRVILREKLSDYLNDLHTEECEARQERESPPEYFENEENDMNT